MGALEPPEGWPLPAIEHAEALMRQVVEYLEYELGRLEDRERLTADWREWVGARLTARLVGGRPLPRRNL